MIMTEPKPVFYKYLYFYNPMYAPMCTLVFPMMQRHFSSLRIYIRWSLQALAPVKGALCACTLAGLGKVVCGLAFILQSKHLIDCATTHTNSSLLPSALQLIGWTLCGLLLSTAGNYLGTYTVNRVKNSLRQRLFDHLLHTPSNPRESLHSGDLTARFEEDVHQVTTQLAGSLPMILITLVQLAGAFGLLLLFDCRLAWIIVSLLPFALLLGKMLTHRLRKLTRTIRQNESHIQSHVQEGLQHGELFRALRAESQSSHTLRTLQQEVFRLILYRTRYTLTSRVLLAAGSATGYLTALIWGCCLLQQGSISFGVMAAFLQLVGQIQGPISRLAGTLPGLIHATTSIDRLREIETTPTESATDFCGPSRTPGIRFEKVTFGYPGEPELILQTFSHDFTPGSRTAIVGTTGAGKTTLLRLILALIRPDRGNIVLYDGTTQQKISAATRCRLAYVPQGNSLMSGTIEDNLLLGNSQATAADIHQALHTATADFVYDLPEGLQTRCGEGGKGLSEGQAQRIALARGLLQAAPVLLLDEITAALDAETEDLLLSRLHRATPHQTLIFVTHRPKVIDWCTHTLKFGNGLC